MLKYLLTVILIAASSLTYASEVYKIYVPNPPGIGSDLVARKLSEIYQKQTGNQLVVMNVPGGSHVVAVNAFLDDQSPAAIIGTSPMHSYNYVLLKDRITYNDDNFHHLFYFGDQPWVYITRPDSSIKNIQDIYTKLPESKKPFIGSSGSNTLMNIMSLNHSKNIKLTPVEYKSPQDIVLGVLRNEIDVGIVSLGGSSALELVRNGDLKILGSTFSDYVSIQNIKVPSVSKQTGAVQFSGFTTLSTNKKGSTQFAKDLFRAVSSQEMIDFLGQNLIFHTRYDYTKTKELIQEKRELIEKRSTWLVTQ